VLPNQPLNSTKNATTIALSILRVALKLAADDSDKNYNKFTNIISSLLMAII
jgi:hypothetical protein